MAPEPHGGRRRDGPSGSSSVLLLVTALALLAIIPAFAAAVALPEGTLHAADAQRDAAPRNPLSARDELAGTGAAWAGEEGEFVADEGSSLRRRLLASPSTPSVPLNRQLRCNVNYAVSPTTISLDLSGRQCNGTLPSAWSALTSLTSLFLNNNNINGTLPEGWSNLRRLQQLGISFNQLTGTLPQSWSTLEDLTEINLDHNRLNGTLPTSWSALRGLYAYRFTDNKLTGTLPLAWSAMTALTTIWLDTNALTGPIPESWSTFSLLNNFAAYSNKLSGTLPAAWGGALRTLQNIALFDNMLSGSLPEAWTGLSAVRTIWVATNNLTGTLPEAWSAFESLQLSSLIAYENKFTGTLPTAWSNLTMMTQIWLYTNRLTGSLPKEWSRLTNLVQLVASNNSFTGTLPAGYSALTQANWLDFRSNNLTGTLPPEWSAWADAGKACQLTLYNNVQLNGSLPQSWVNAQALYDVGCTAVNLHSTVNSSVFPRCSLPEIFPYYPGCTRTLCSNTPPLEQLLKCDTPYRLPATTTVLDLTGGNCTGTLPMEWSSLVSLQSLTLSSNNITGTLPPSWGALTNLTSLWLDNNHIGGPLPEQWGQMQLLKAVDLHQNQLTGTLPALWNATVNLTFAGFGNNHITGPLPQDWSVLSRLTLLELSDNNITGTLPAQWSALGNASTPCMVPLYNNPSLSGIVPQQWVSAGVTYDVGCTNVTISVTNSTSVNGTGSVNAIATATAGNGDRCDLPLLDWPVCRTDGSCGQSNASGPPRRPPAISDGTLRLAGGNASSGRLEVYSVARAAWGTVCENSFSKNAARVACRQLGFSDSTAAVRFSTVPTPHTYGPPPARIFLDGFCCSGNEARLTQCAGTFPTSNTCNPDHSGDIALYCQPL